MTHKHETSAATRSQADAPLLRFNRRWAEGAVLLVVLAAGFWFWSEAQSIQTRSGDAVGARSFPASLALILMAVTLAALIALTRLPSGTHVTVRRPGALVFTMAMLMAFPWLVETLGYYVVVVPWVLAFGWAARVRTPFLVAITLGSVLFVALVIFQMTLGTPLP